jgi:hypothetical protein
MKCRLACRFDRRYWVVIGGLGLPPAGYDLGGVSGGPMLQPVYREGMRGWRLIGVISGHDDILGDIYANRSTVEHLHEDRLLEPFDRAKRLELLRQEAIIEYVTRTSLCRIVGDEQLWPHFANRAGIERFWALDSARQRAIWGPPIDPMDALAAFDPKYIHDGHLGA